MVKTRTERNPFTWPAMLQMRLSRIHSCATNLALVVLLPCFHLIADPFTADLSHGDASIKLETSPEKVSPARDYLLTLTIEAPAHLVVSLPDLRDRFSGFSTAEDFATPPIEANGRIRQTVRWRLVPEPAADQYRLAPFAVTTHDKRQPDVPPTSFATPAVYFPAEAPLAPVDGAPEVSPTPFYIHPTAQTIALWVIVALIGLAALVALIYGLMHLGHRVREMRMSPVERALAELDRLLKRKLPDRGLYKEFYIELTMVVRRYIERTRGIRAPEQTTQEFLAAATEHATFTSEVLAELKRFLESADLVKFAGQEATPEMAHDATTKARNTIASDSHHFQSNT